MASAVVGTLLMLAVTVAMSAMVIKTGNDMSQALNLQSQANACVIRGMTLQGNFTTYWNGAVCVEILRECQAAGQPTCRDETP